MQERQQLITLQNIAIQMDQNSTEMHRFDFFQIGCFQLNIKQFTQIEHIFENIAETSPIWFANCPSRFQTYPIVNENG